jgi:Interferon-induced transmembrane protein
MANEASPQAHGRGQSRPHYPPPKPPPPPADYRPGTYVTRGYEPGGVPATAQPSAYWPLTIISFLLSFLFGGIAMYFSAQVGNRWRAGDFAGAHKASKTALIWGIIGLAVGLFVFFAVLGSEGSSY